MIYRFGDCELDDRRYELRRGGVPCHLEPQVFEVLAYQVRRFATMKANVAAVFPTARSRPTLVRPTD